MTELGEMKKTKLFRSIFQLRLVKSHVSRFLTNEIKKIL